MTSNRDSALRFVKAKAYDYLREMEEPAEEEDGGKKDKKGKGAPADEPVEEGKEPPKNSVKDLKQKLVEDILDLEN